MTRKEYVDVIAFFDTQGKLNPIKIRLSDGSSHMIDKILEVKKCPDLILGGIGTRYSVRIGSNNIHLYLQDGRR